MAVSKVIYKSSPSATPETWIDATTATATASDIISPKTAMLADGEMTTGTGTRDEWIRRATNINNLFANSANMPSLVELYLDAFGTLASTTASTASQVFVRSYAPNSDKFDVIIHLPSPANSGLISFYRFFYQAYGVDNIDIIGDVSNVNDYTDMLAYMSGLKSIDMEFDFHLCDTEAKCRLNTNSANNYLTSLRYKKDTLSYSQNLSKFTALNDASLVSIANGLNANASAQTLTLYSTLTTACSSIMGIVSDGIFTEDVNGTLSLSDFITTTKGWTLA